MAKIKRISAREILDSRGNPTVEAEVETKDGVFTDSVPSGASLGKYEAVELKDNEARYCGKGVLKAVENVNSIIALKLKGIDSSNQEKIDKLMIKLDGTENKSKLGANAILAVSMAVSRAGAASKNIALWKYIARLSKTKDIKIPKPSMLMIEGGKHAGNILDMQEFMIICEDGLYSDALRKSTEIYHCLNDILSEKYGKNATNVGFEGGFTVPTLRKTEEVLDAISNAVKKAGHEGKIKIAIDAAASVFFRNENYEFEGFKIKREELLDFYSALCEKYSIGLIEDPYSEEDSEGFKMITKKMGKQVAIIGDDLLVTNKEKIKEAIGEKLCNGLLLKLNQIGTVSEALEAGNIAKSAKWKIMVSHRSGDTTDDFVSDLAVGIGADFVKFGAPARGERVVKYNRLLKIEKEAEKFISKK